LWHDGNWIGALREAVGPWPFVGGDGGEGVVGEETGQMVILLEAMTGRTSAAHGGATERR